MSPNGVFRARLNQTIDLRHLSAVLPILWLFELGGRLSLSQIAEAPSVVRSTVLHHRKVQHETEGLASEKIGKEICFSINRAALETRLGNVLDYLKENT